MRIYISAKDIEEGREETLEQWQIENLRKQLKARRNEIKEQLVINEVPPTTELSQYDNHPADSASDLTTQVTSMVLEKHHEEELQQIELALQAMKNQTYGICSVCGEAIPFERLEIVPTTFTCVDHAPNNRIDQTIRPVEEEVIREVTPSMNFTIAQHANSSDTPSDTQI